MMLIYKVTKVHKSWFLSVSELQEEGKHAIEAPTSPTVPDIGPEGYTLGKGTHHCWKSRTL